ncbi:hypothetical protein [Pseudoalteromonas obscura]|uniref:Uncharacterized protein n=1 Tax=Pseudoalteromonas obscura TaxID=3048491 RepID=A0ABT7EH92_9GAMM|nr:hypothetical protein [Pseudoalteromonas sp. P94(2023)]MDK2594384.1 hypothetical protein [Pseudoalteromonas sp. P94(2023)]
MQRSDLKIFKPERLGNETNAGGHRTANAIISGKLNDVFSAISDVDHASSSLDLVKLYPTVFTPDATRLLNAHIFVSDQPDDPLVSTLIADSSHLKDESLLSDMSDMLKTAVYHGTSNITKEAGGKELVIKNTSRTVAPTVVNRIARTGLKIGNDSLFRTQKLTSYGNMTQINLEVPDLLTDRPNYHGIYSYWSSGWQRWATKRVFFNEVNRNGTSISINLNSQFPLVSGQTFTFFYMSSNDFRWHRFPAQLTLAPGERVLPGYSRIKKTGVNEVFTDDGEGRFVENGYVIATIDYDSGVITEIETIDYNGSVSDDLGVMVVKRQQVTKSLNFNLDIPSFAMSSLYIKFATSSGVNLSASADDNGNISGENVSGTVTSSGDVTLTFLVDVLPDTLTYDVDQLEEVTMPTPPGSIDYNKLPSGSVPIFHEDHLVCIQHRERTAHSSLSVGQTLNVLADADWLDIVDSNGKSLYSSNDENYSYNKATGVLTINVGISAFLAPFVVTTIQAELVQIQSISGQTAQLFTELSRSYPQGSTVSSVQRLGDLQARTADERTLSGWNNDFSANGAQASNSVNTVQYPIEMKNQGAINQRWAIVFTSNSEFEVLGESVGIVATGNTSVDCMPMNPLTTAPFFKLPKEAFGSGLNPGEAFLFTTYAGSAPTMLIRSVSPGHTNIETDNSTIAFRGSL